MKYLLLSASLFFLPALLAEEPGMEKTALWTSGQDGYHTYRIPALLVTGKGSVLAFCEGRKTGAGDHGDVDLLMKRSTDGGRTWSPHQIVHEEGGEAKITIGNPCPVEDADTDTIWLPFNRDNKAVFITSSSDDGLTWSPPREISASTMKPDWTWVASGPGIGIQLKHGPHKGRLVIPSDHKRVNSSGAVEMNSHMMFSDDGGQTWQTGSPIQAGGNECQVMERGDGSLLINTRMQGNFEGYRGIATSMDGGATWTAIRQETQLPCPRCQGSLLDAGPGTLLFSNPDPGMSLAGKNKGPRINLTVRLSRDEGAAWPVARLLHQGPAAYSCLARLPDGTVLCLYEGGDRTFRETLTLARFDLPWLTWAQEDLNGPPAVTVGSWGIADAESKELLWSHLPDQPRKAASTTKMMCAYVILEMAQKNPAVLDEKVLISRLAAGTAGSTSELEEGEQVRVLDGLYALLLPSGNDMGNAFAEHFHPRLAPPGSETPEAAQTPASATRMNFVAEMNRTARRLGMKSTRYHISYGDGGTADDRTTTVRDLVTLAHAAQMHPLFRQITSSQTWTAKVHSPDGHERQAVWENTNKLLQWSNYDGVKTGTTPTAGRCLVASGSHDGRRLLVVTLGSTSDESRFADSRNLFRWAWQRLKELPASNAKTSR